MKIYKNILNSPRIVWHKNYTGSYGTLPPVTFEGNNIYCEEYFISYRSTILESEFMVNGNYIEGCLTISDVKDLCYDQLEIDLNNEMIVVENLSLTPLENAGIVETVN